MKEETKRQKLAALLGIPLSEIPKSSYREKPDDKSREADAVIAYVARPQDFKHKACINCGGMFATNQPSVGMCSDSCRVRHLERKGIQWDPHKKQTERWGYVLPLTVPVEALDVIRKALLPEPVPQERDVPIPQ